MPEFHEIANIFPMMDDHEFSGLVQSMRTHGWQNDSHILLFEEQILDGRNREIASDELGIEPKYVEFTGTHDEALDFVYSKHANRRDVDTGTKAMLYLAVEDKKEISIWKKEAKARQLAGVSQTFLSDGEEGCNSKMTALHNEVVTKMALAAGVSRATMYRATKLKRENPDLAAQVQYRESSLYKALQTHEREQQKEWDPGPLPEGQFSLIYADPPWRYEHSRTPNREIENQYPTMTLEEIKKIEVPAAEHCILYLWATTPKLKEAMEVMQEWGFDYRSSMVWIKDKVGMGYWARGKHELLLIGRKGKAKPPHEFNRLESVIAEEEGTVIEHDRGEHSVKPILHNMLDELYPLLKKVELFAREELNLENWSVWGNQVGMKKTP
jgi:N6-adenosine-specific RNA methylase IME4